MLANPKLQKKPFTDLTRQGLIERFRNILTSHPEYRRFGPAHQTLILEALRYKFENEEIKPIKTKEKLNKKEIEDGVTPRTKITFKFIWEMPGLGHKIELETSMWEAEYNRLGH